MKIRNAVLCLALVFAGSVSFVMGQSLSGEAKVIPTEVSEPPYEVGDLVTVQGYYIDRPDKPSINFRIVGNKIRIYWIDADGLIAEPEFSVASVRFTDDSVRARSYHRAKLLPGGAGLGAPAVIPPPHTFNLVLVFGSDDEPGQETYTFRYVPAMNEAKAPEIPAASSGSTNPTH